MHRYFLDRGEGLSTKQGRFGMLAELVAIERDLRKATAITSGMRIALTKTLDGAPDEESGGVTVFSMELNVKEG